MVAWSQPLMADDCNSCSTSPIHSHPHPFAVPAAAELPIVFKVAGNSQGINAPSSIGQRQQQQQSPTSAALPGSFEEVRVVVDFTSVRLLQLVQQATAAVPAGSTPWQQQQQQQQDISANGRDQDQAQDSSNSSAIARELGSTAAAASARQLEAVLLSTSPRMLVVDGFFDAQLCNDLMELAEGKLVRSRVASGRLGIIWMCSHLGFVSQGSQQPACGV